jgi:hypothetical protein
MGKLILLRTDETYLRLPVEPGSGHDRMRPLVLLQSVEDIFTPNCTIFYIRSCGRPNIDIDLTWASFYSPFIPETSGKMALSFLFPSLPLLPAQTSFSY